MAFHQPGTKHYSRVVLLKKKLLKVMFSKATIQGTSNTVPQLEIKKKYTGKIEIKVHKVSSNIYLYDDLLLTKLSNSKL
jgi:hypothetical protein